MANSIETYSDAEVCKAILSRNYTNVGREFIDDQVTRIRPFAFSECTTIDKISCPNVTYIDRQAMSGCTATDVEFAWSRITRIDFKAFYGTSAASANATTQRTLNLAAVATVGESAFGNQAAYTAPIPLEHVSAPLLASVPNSCFRYQTGLITAMFAIGKPSGASVFEGCTSLQKVRLGGELTALQSRMFYGDTALDTLILDGVTAVPTLGNSNSFQGTKIEAKTGYIYVPRNLVSGFQSATRWSAYNYRAIEDYPGLLA